MASSWLERTGDEEEAREQICLNSAHGVLFPVYAARFGKRLVRRWQKGVDYSFLVSPITVKRCQEQGKKCRSKRRGGKAGQMCKTGSLQLVLTPSTLNNDAVGAHVPSFLQAAR